MYEYVIEKNYGMESTSQETNMQNVLTLHGPFKTCRVT